jgi:hypothetical protein
MYLRFRHSPSYPLPPPPSDLFWLLELSPKWTSLDLLYGSWLAVYSKALRISRCFSLCLFFWKSPRFCAVIRLGRNEAVVGGTRGDLSTNPSKRNSSATSHFAINCCGLICSTTTHYGIGSCQLHGEVAQKQACWRPVPH